MKHRIVILGAGYAGASAAGHLARHLRPDDVEITVLTAEPDFVERMRLHQLAAGHELARRPLTELFAGTHIRLRATRIVGLDVERRTVTVSDGSTATTDRIEYDTLLYALGSVVDDHGVAGVAEHAFDVAGRPAASRLRGRLDELGQGGRVLVVGGGLTAIETATEIAESRPELTVALATSGEVACWLSPTARRHLAGAFARFGVEVHEHATVEAVTAAGVRCAGGQEMTSDVTVWAAGFAASRIADAAGLAVEPDGRITVDPGMRSISHPTVFAAGDSAYAVGDNGSPLPMSCASAGSTSTRAVATIVEELTGHVRPRTSLVHIGNHISLGRTDAIVQMVDRDARSKPWAVRGRQAARFKAAVLRAVLWSVGHPTFGMPVRRRPVRGATGREPRRSAAARFLRAVADRLRRLRSRTPEREPVTGGVIPPSAMTRPVSFTPSYVDRFVLRTDTDASARDWATAAFEDGISRSDRDLVFTTLLGLAPAADGAPGCVAGWTVVSQDDRHVRIETGGSGAVGALLIERRETTVSLTTALGFTSTARAAIWTVLSHVHRRQAAPTLRNASELLRRRGRPEAGG